MHELPPLPFSKDALAPWMSAETVHFHYDKHHRAYIEKLNKLVKGTLYEGMSLEETVFEATGSIYNNAAQAWNHTFFWNCLSPSEQKPSGQLLEMIEAEFDSLNIFFEEFKNKGVEHFASGWIWLIEKDGLLKIEDTSDGDNWIQTESKALLTCDLWEHAYYIDYRNDREKFLDGFSAHINWEFVAENLNPAQFRHHQVTPTPEI